ncbi:hypothetical protein ACLOJK_013926 [Asimina triloba]
MADPGDGASLHPRKNLLFGRAWCCAFVSPKSPENHRWSPVKPPKSEASKTVSNSSFPNSPINGRLGALGFGARIDPRRILSPGRVSPIDSDAALDPLPEIAVEPEPEPAPLLLPERECTLSRERSLTAAASVISTEGFDLRLDLKGKDGRRLRLEMDSEVLAANSPVFAAMIAESRRKGVDDRGRCVIEVGDVGNLGVFRETIELMFEKDVPKWLMKAGVSRTIDILELAMERHPIQRVAWEDPNYKLRYVGKGHESIFHAYYESLALPYYLIQPTFMVAFGTYFSSLEMSDTINFLCKMMERIHIAVVASSIMFDRGVASCLYYLEAVPWCENEEDKLKSLFSRCTFDEAVSQVVLARLRMQDSVSQPLAIYLIQSITRGSDANARRELKALVKGLLSASSVYQKEPAGLTKEALYMICDSCFHLLENCFKESSNPAPKAKESPRTLIGRISEQVDNINWILEILFDRQMAEEFVVLWANQRELLSLHDKASPMVRYELSRISAHIFIALGRGKLQCRGDERYNVLRAWFGPMLIDFGWLQRCSKGLDLRDLEDAMGQALLTLPLKRQQSMFLEWFACFSRCGTECPDLSRAFQIWWRRSCSRSTVAEPQL